MIGWNNMCAREIYCKPKKNVEIRKMLMITIYYVLCFSFGESNLLFSSFSSISPVSPITLPACRVVLLWAIIIIRREVNCNIDYAYKTFMLLIGRSQSKAAACLRNHLIKNEA